MEYPATFYYSLNQYPWQVKLSGVGQRKITKYAIFDYQYPIGVQDSPLDGQNTKIGGYGDFMARGGGTFSPVESMLAIRIF
jgi:hypothetical protein